tara:strand:- start:242 stop:775 length:534 start_codon:yes stop_codon:yes gene_type:complete
MNEDFLRRLNHMSEKVAEERLMGATQKNYIGINGKIASIARLMGKPILSQGYGDSGCFTDCLLDIPVLDDYHLEKVGWVWDGLSRGIHLEIRLDNFKREIIATFKGHNVYRECAGDLELYTPIHPLAGEWEHHIEKLYKEAKKIRRIEKVEEEEAKKEMQPGLAQRLLEALKMRWGE